MILMLQMLDLTMLARKNCFTESKHQTSKKKYFEIMSDGKSKAWFPLNRKVSQHFSTAVLHNAILATLCDTLRFMETRLSLHLQKLISSSIVVSV